LCTQDRTEDAPKTKRVLSKVVMLRLKPYGVHIVDCKLRMQNHRGDFMWPREFSERTNGECKVYTI